ncbi:phage tail protein [Arenimonas sp. MALMAid1274]|uniref:phage tail protein n=1 Tax=Arenimonas sp. MALMAid1274 TaxID=3411630 RepID=UPI003BA10B0E
MSSPYIGEIQLFGFNFAPRSWAFCSGAAIPIVQNTALFALLGTQYGGNGTTTFRLPNFSARAASQQGQGPGLTPRTIGETFGQAAVTLTANEIPSHTHPFVLYAQNDASKRAGAPASGSGLSVSSLATARSFLPGGAPNTSFAPGMVSPFFGGSQPHSNQQPYLGVNFCIALQGVFPSFN